MKKSVKGVSLDTAARRLTGGQYVRQTSLGKLDTSDVSKAIQQMKRSCTEVQPNRSL